MIVFNIAKDEVIRGTCGLAEANYEYALQNIYPLLNKLDEQRKLIDKKFYKRLERDIIKGCLMPPLTLAFINKEIPINTVEELGKFVIKNIGEGFVLDGIQRLNTLKRASENSDFNEKKEIYFNIIIAENKDKLLYRMITLNNGQKGMTPRHQIEILTKELFNFKELKIKVQTEKEKAENPIKDSFSLGDIAKGYMAFLTNNVNNENSKIIEEKMDEILVGRILDNDLNNNEIEFFELLKIIDKCSDNINCLNWFRTVNNLIGYSAGAITSYKFIESLTSDELEQLLEKFEKSFKTLNTSKINLGKSRRELSREFIENLEEYSRYDNEELDEKFFELTVTE